MIGDCVRRGLAAGCAAGALAALFALLFAEPSVEAAIEVEEAATAQALPAPAARGHAHVRGASDELSRGTQKIGLVAGMVLYGLGLGALFGVAAAWARGRLRGDAWVRSLKLGASVLLALVALPALANPPNPPGVGDPDTVAARAALYVSVWAFGLLLAGFTWSGARLLEAKGWSRPAAQTLVGLAVAAALAVLLAVVPNGPAAGPFPADVLWSFRLASFGTQAVLYGSLAVGYGLLAARAELGARRSRARGA